MWSLRSLTSLSLKIPLEITPRLSSSADILLEWFVVLTRGRAEWDTAVAAARKKWQTYSGLAAKLPPGSIGVAVPDKMVFDLKVDTADARLQINFKEVRALARPRNADIDAPFFRRCPRRRRRTQQSLPRQRRTSWCGGAAEQA